MLIPTLFGTGHRTDFSDDKGGVKLGTVESSDHTLVVYDRTGQIWLTEVDQNHSVTESDREPERVESLSLYETTVLTDKLSPAIVLGLRDKKLNLSDA